LGDELTSKSIQALQQVKQQLEQQRMADLEQWEKDFKQNTVAKFTAREPNLRQRATSTPMVAMPGEKHSDLKARLGQLNKAIEKQGILDNLVQKLDKKGLLTPNIEAGVDTSMLVRDGARDNYVELNRKLDKALEYVKNRLLTNKAAYAKPKAIDEDDSAPTRMRMNDYMDLADAIQEKLRHAIQMGDKARIQELNKQRDELDAHVKKHGMMPEDIAEEQLDELSCWSGYHRVAGTKAGFPGSCAKNKTNEEDVAEEKHSCPHCGGEMVSEELMNEKKDACYYKVKSRYKVWPSAYASGALVKCRKKGAKNWGNSSKNESSILEGIERADENLHQWFKEKWVRFGPDGKIRGDCARGDDSEGKPKCLPQSKAQNLGKKGRASAAARKRREDPNPERSGKAINVNTKKK
jgi:ssDNA-binding Zn-finger/Zn-ribbon topoisomerase 1/ubiquitin